MEIIGNNFVFNHLRLIYAFNFFYLSILAFIYNKIPIEL